MSGDEPAENDIAGPEQRREREQQIGLIEEPAADAAMTLRAYPRHDPLALLSTAAQSPQLAPKAKSGQPRDRITAATANLDNWPARPLSGAGMPQQGVS